MDHTGWTTRTMDAWPASVAGASVEPVQPFARKRLGHAGVPSSESLAEDSQPPGVGACRRGPGGHPFARGPFPDTGRCQHRNAARCVEAACLWERHAAPVLDQGLLASEASLRTDGQFRSVPRHLPSGFPEELPRPPVTSLTAAGPVPALQRRKRGGSRTAGGVGPTPRQASGRGPFRQQEAALS